jgi:antitoxin (DNA-binding transcriptional repressor) of toxin-antitoxin stability system
LLEYFREIEKSGEPLIITDRGRPVLKVVPFSSDRPDVRAALRNTVLRYDGPTEPVGAEDWESTK